MVKAKAKVKAKPKPGKKQIEITPELFAKHPKLFIERFFYIIDKERKQVPFLLNAVQGVFDKNRSLFDLVLKARKEGISAIIEAIFTVLCVFVPNTRAVLMSHETDSTKRHFERVKYFLDTMGVGDTRLTIPLDRETQKEMSFPATNSSYWIGTAGSRAFGRGDDISALHLTEVAHYADQSAVTGVLEACVPGAWRVLETTANGSGDLFHKLWEESKDPETKSRWKRHFFAWFEDKSYCLPVPEGVPLRLSPKLLKMKKDYKLSDGQLLWYRDKEANLADRSLMPQEYPCNDEEAFLASGRHYFNQESLSRMSAKCSEPKFVGEFYDDGANIRFREDDSGACKVWKMPRDGRHYAIFADVAEGIAGGAWSVAHVIDRASWEQVAVWRGHVDPGKFGKVMVDIGIGYRNALLWPENNNHGWATIERIKAEGYPHLGRTDELWPDSHSVKDGFPTNEKTKNLCFSALRRAYDDQTIYVNDRTTIRESVTVVIDDAGHITPDTDCFMDTVSGLAIGAYVLQYLSLDETYADRAKGDETGTEPLYVQSLANAGGSGSTRSRRGGISGKRPW